MTDPLIWMMIMTMMTERSEHVVLKKMKTFCDIRVTLPIASQMISLRRIFDLKLLRRLILQSYIYRIKDRVHFQNLRTTFERSSKIF